MCIYIYIYIYICAIACALLARVGGISNTVGAVSTLGSFGALFFGKVASEDSDTASFLSRLKDSAEYGSRPSVTSQRLLGAPC